MLGQVRTPNSFFDDQEKSMDFWPTSTQTSVTKFFRKFSIGSPPSDFMRLHGGSFVHSALFDYLKKSDLQIKYLAFFQPQ